MLYFDRINVSEGIYVNKTNKLKERDVCHYWCFLNGGSKFQPYVCNSCHDLLMTSMNLRNIDVLKIKGSDDRCIISGYSKNESIKLMQNPDLIEKSKALESIEISIQIPKWAKKS